MKRIHYVAVALLSIFFVGYGCSKDTVQGPTSQPDGIVSVSLPIGISTQEVVTRTNEQRIADVNLFLVQGKRVQQHIYTPDKEVEFSCSVGNYRLFVIANHHTNLGNLSYDELLSFSISNQDNYNDLPMYAIQSVEITATKGTLVLPVLEVQRAVAKVNYSVMVHRAVPDIQIKSVQAMRLPYIASPFSDFTPSDVPDNYFDGSVKVNSGEVSRMAGSFYMLPNLQGDVASVLTPQQKNERNAPVMASYLRIRAIRGNKVLDYAVYLGENETSDFNVRPNTAHTYSITIRNDNEADLRIRSYTIDAQSKMDAEPENGIYLQMAPIALTISLSGRMQDMNLSCKLKVTSGNSDFFAVNGTLAQSQYTLQLNANPGSSHFAIDYHTPTFAPENVQLRYTLTFSDRYGEVATYDFSFYYAYVIKVYMKWYGGNMIHHNYGKLFSPDALHWVESGSISSVFYLFYCSNQGCTIVALPDEGRKFHGWYSGYDYTGWMSSDPIFHYTPTSPRDVLYTYMN